MTRLRKPNNLAGHKSLSRNRLWLALIAVGMLASGAMLVVQYHKQSEIRQEARESVEPGSLSRLLSLRTDQLAGLDIARLNLLSAEGLRGAEDLEVNRCLAILDAMANRVRTETDRHKYRFQEKPAEFENSEGFFRMLMLTVVMAEDYGLRYDPERQNSPLAATEGDGFFADSSKVFLPGLLGSKRQGTCSSMPVLYVAVGRRLGYPLKLVTTKGHLFVRWEDADERFNVEATSHGLNRFADDYYRHWPFVISVSEEAREGYLKSLSPAEELAVFLSIRGMCQREGGNGPGAAESFTAAARLAPACGSYREMAGQLERKVAGR